MPISTTILSLAAAARPASLPTPDWTPWALIGAGAVLLALWGYGKKRTSTNNRGSSSLADRLLGRAAVTGRGTPNTSTEGDALGSDLEDLADHLCARMDERAERLESLLARAEETLARLELADRRVLAEESSPPLVEVVRTPLRARAPASVESAADPLSRRVYELADSGREPLDIARSLDEQVGKVQLILALRES